MNRGTTSRWSRRFVIASAFFFVAWRVGELVGIAHQAAMTLALFGFVFHIIFGKAYLLIPSYFERVFAVPRAMPVHFALSSLGTVLLTLGSAASVPPLVSLFGAVAWSLGVVIFLGGLGWSVRGNPFGRETGTGSIRLGYERADRFANLFPPVSFAYLALGSYELLARTTTLPALTDGYLPRLSHLLGAGAAGVLVFALGSRLLPRFFDVRPPTPFIFVVLPTGALAPILLATNLWGGFWFRVGAVAEATAMVGFATLTVICFVRSDRRRVGLYGVLAGSLAGAIAVALGLSFAFDGASAALLAAHRELNLLGFLGLTIVGLVFQFYPPSAGRFLGASEQSAGVVVAALAGGLAIEVVGLGVGGAPVVVAGNVVSLLGTLGYAFLLTRLLVEIGSRRSG
ncbi:hypothetical protein BG842_18430 [Haladaptatus sp. W1]|uniref:hypothetical protein n=1 Tax=Haladaptatus sp. W1 TaxID=1897478 RepID=UPI0008499F77|nr:hypothetical protein [Haladaptatus sp. W1]ODR82553.1 hypothetical protein BG842_18430 [Haladaptatus sp. W1]